ncbi:hypothetical protein DYR40_09135, partial [Campylobacter coli]|nr:hypothetical protein [Campylobacter coli]
LAGKEIYQESLKSKCVKNESYNLIIWISLLWSNKKSKRWFNQTDLTIFLLKELQKYFPKILAYFDGLRSYDDSIMSSDNDNGGWSNVSIIIDNIKKTIQSCRCDFIR